VVFWDLMQVLANHTSNGDLDVRSWRWDSKGFSTSLYYKFPSFGGVSINFAHIWQIVAPLKDKLLIWLCIRERLNTKDLLIKKGIQTHPVCVLCGVQNENHAHLFLECRWVQNLWHSLKHRF